MKKPTYKQLEIMLTEALASSPIRYSSAHSNLKNASIDRLMGSGVLVSLQFIGGKNIVEPLLIRDGLSNETIESLKKDIVRSNDLATMFKII